MPTKAKTRAAGTNLPVPQTDEEAERMISELGALQVELAEAQAAHDQAAHALESKHGEVVKTSKQQQAAIVEGLSIWASAHRERLTRGGKTKTVKLATGTILWREGRYSVKHRGVKVEEVIAAIQDRIAAIRAGVLTGVMLSEVVDLQSFLRHKTELNKDAMLASITYAEKIPGVTVPRGPEEFSVEPLAGQVRGDA